MKLVPTNPFPFMDYTLNKRLVEQIISNTATLLLCSGLMSCHVLPLTSSGVFINEASRSVCKHFNARSDRTSSSASPLFVLHEAVQLPC